MESNELCSKKVLSGLNAGGNVDGLVAAIGNQVCDGPILSCDIQTILLDLEPAIPISYVSNGIGDFLQVG